MLGAQNIRPFVYAIGDRLSCSKTGEQYFYYEIGVSVCLSVLYEIVIIYTEHGEASGALVSGSV